MALIDQVQAQGSTEHLAAVNDVREALRAVFWGWYYDHSEDVILSKRIVVFNVKIRVSDIRFLFVQFFGNPVL